MDAAETFARAYFEKVRQAKLSMLPGLFSTTHAITLLVDTYRAHHPVALESPSTADSSHFGDRKVIPPQPEWVTAYSASIGYPMDGQAWCDAYESKGWVVSGKTKMKDWQAAVRNWKTNRYGMGTVAKAKAATTTADTTEGYTKF